MKKKSASYQDAILGQAKDFNFVQDMMIADNGSVEVTGWSVNEAEMPPAAEKEGNLLDDLPIRNTIITDN